MEPLEREELEQLLQAKGRVELIGLAKAFKLVGYKELTKAELIAELLKDPVRLKRKLSPTFWEKHNVHIYGIASIIGLVIAVVSVLPGLRGEKADTEATSPLPEAVREGAVAVMPFENKAVDPELASMGMMIMDWVSQGLLESGGAQVIKEDANALITHLEKDPDYVPEGAQVLIRGRYYTTDAQHVTVVAEIVDARTNVAIYTPQPFHGERDDIMGLIERIKQQVLGYWVLKEEYKDHKPPRYDAYQAYIKGVETSYRELEQRTGHLFTAMRLDPEFYRPGISLMWTGVNTGRPDLVDSADVWLAARAGKFNEYERLNYKMARTRGYGKFEEGAEAGWEMYTRFNDVGAGRVALYFYNSANMLSKVSRHFHEMERKEGDKMYEDPRMRATICYQMNALVKRGHPDSAAMLFERLTYEFTDAFPPIMGLMAYSHMGRLDKVDALLDRSLDRKLTYSDIDMTLWLPYVVCTPLYMQDHPALPKYLDLWDRTIERSSPEQDMSFYNTKAVLAYMRGDLEQAYAHAQAHYHTTDWGKGLNSQASALILIKMGKEKEAREWMEFLKQQPKFYTGQLDYALGMFHGYLGEPKVAREHFKRCIDEGFDYDWYDFRDDPFWKELMQYPELVAFTEPT